MNIVSRYEWSAKPPTQPLTRAQLPMRELWLHHSVTKPTSNPRADARLIQEIAFQRGFTDISYTALFHPDGTILEGRDYRFVGAHTKDHNSISLAGCLIGNYETDDRPTDAQILAFRWWRAQMVKAGALTPDHKFGPHKQVYATACPGFSAIGVLARFAEPYQSEVAPMINPPVGIPSPIVAEAWPQVDGKIVGHLQLTEDGRIYAWGYARHCGAPYGQPYWQGRKAAQLELTATGYTVVAASGERYDYSG